MTFESITSFKLIGSGDDYYNQVVDQIGQAQSEIIMESYIFEFDEVGKRILDALAEAAKRNIFIRLMIDGIGSYTQTSVIREFCTIHGIQFRVYRPLPKLLVDYTRFTQFMRTANRRNHRKVIIIDQQIAFIASLNISRVHSEKILGKNAWKDLAAQISGPEVIKIHQLTNAYWSKFYFSIKGRIPKINFVRIRSTHSMAARRASRNLLFQKIRQSKNHIKILTPYFVPSIKLIRALKQASQAHQNIEIIIPVRSDFLIVDMASRHIIRTLLTKKIKIYQYQPSFLHAKCLSVDNWATLGSHNVNHRSLVHDLELDVTLEKPDELSSLEHYWEQIKINSRLITREELIQDSIFKRLLCRFSFWFKYWL